MRIGVESRKSAEGVAGDEALRARRRGAEGGAERVVVHREMLRVIPDRGDGIAVEVSHDLVGDDYIVVGAELRGRQREKIIHQAKMKRGLLVGVVVILVAGRGLGRR